MKKKIILLATVALSLSLFSFKENPSATTHKKEIKKFDVTQIGYFVSGGQEYDAYGSTSGITQLYKTDNDGNDVSLVTITAQTAPTFSGGLWHINVTFTDGVSKHYVGTTND